MAYTLEQRRARDKARRAAGIADQGKPDIRCCWRCGVTWDGGYQYIDAAPCRDCRQFLRVIDGDTTVYRRSTLRQLERAA